MEGDAEAEKPKPKGKKGVATMHEEIAEEARADEAEAKKEAGEARGALITSLRQQVKDAKGDGDKRVAEVAKDRDNWRGLFRMHLAVDLIVFLMFAGAAVGLKQFGGKLPFGLGDVNWSTADVGVDERAPRVEAINEAVETLEDGP